MVLTLEAAADSMLAVMDRYERGKAKAEPKPTAKANVAATSDADAGTGEPLPGGDGGINPADIPDDPDAMMEMVLTEVREQLDWDGRSGDPNESLAALEDSLADMFDADVEIVWDGQSQLTLRVEGEEPVPLTVDYLGELLEELAKSGADDSDASSDGADVGAERGHRGMVGKFTEELHPRVLGGAGGGRFTKKAGGAVASKAKTAPAPARPAGGKAAGPHPAGPHPTKLAGRAAGRAGPRATSKAVSGALSSVTGKRVRVAGNKDGSFSVGPKKQKMSGKRVAANMIPAWLAFVGSGGAFLGAAVGGLPLGLAVAGGTAATLKLMKALRS